MVTPRPVQRTRPEPLSSSTGRLGRIRTVRLPNGHHHHHHHHTTGLSRDGLFGTAFANRSNSSSCRRLCTWGFLRERTRFGRDVCRCRVATRTNGLSRGMAKQVTENDHGNRPYTAVMSYVIVTILRTRDNRY